MPSSALRTFTTFPSLVWFLREPALLGRLQPSAAANFATEGGRRKASMTQEYLAVGIGNAAGESSLL
jgi:hypothetical protein